MSSILGGMKQQEERERTRENGEEDSVLGVIPIHICDDMCRHKYLNGVRKLIQNDAILFI